ncbi:hypothetical protein BD410DRAFT_763829 [Rickenella mellea]|uniref:Integral membrane protein S linking to the trans Golgi network-domain-containing protein n=1 Tax=Rickenella mellea TaxID=50990 RepID=A0A4Y7QGP0_9AGAM|nr:hypothetical protein BD410DRAFT_763829 [Rickenella mellea]
MAPPRSASWDPVLLISQIVSLQALHYLTLSVLIPPVLMMFAEPHALTYEGGAANVGMVMDWRELAGRPTVHGLRGDDRRGWSVFRGAYTGGRRVGAGAGPEEWLDLGDGSHGWDGRLDPFRGWVIAFCWMVACGFDVYYLYTIVRRPRLILDFAITLIFNHVVLTTYYSEALPSSIFFWLVMAAGAAVSVVSAEQLCVRREMREGLNVGVGEVDDIELGERTPRRD